jgi:hypothetical protein
MRRRFAVIVSTVLSVCALAGPASAAVIEFHGLTTNSSGTGFGHVLSILTLQDENPHADNLEAGSVVWNGTSDVFGTVGAGIDTKSQLSQTRAVSEMLSKGMNESNLAVVFNLAQAGSNDALNLHNFTLRFQDASGATLFDATFNDADLSNADTSALTPAGQGIGTSGYEFRVKFSGSEGTNFFANPTNRVGMFINASDAMSNATGGMETFYVAPAVPEPASAALLASLLCGSGLLRRRQ